MRRKDIDVSKVKNLPAARLLAAEMVPDNGTLVLPKTPAEAARDKRRALRKRLNEHTRAHERDMKRKIQD